MRKFVLLLITGICFYATSSMAEQIAKSGPLKVSLIEVYTSEGCSSCIPAWKYLSRFKDEPGLWTNFVPVGFHVDYWDYLGWKDLLAQKRFSDRQRAYAAEWGNGRVYTPGFVLNGREWRSWYKLEDLKNLKKESVGNLTIESVGRDVFKISFEPKKQNAKESMYKAHIALLAFGVVSDITSGENRGRKVSHDFAVVSYAEQNFNLESNGKLVAETKLSFPNVYSTSEKGIAVWVTGAGSMAPIQAAGGLYN